jgi:hypothetical protein
MGRGARFVTVTRDVAILKPSCSTRISYSQHLIEGERAVAAGARPAGLAASRKRDYRIGHICSGLIANGAGNRKRARLSGRLDTNYQQYPNAKGTSRSHTGRSLSLPTISED